MKRFSLLVLAASLAIYAPMMVTAKPLISEPMQLAKVNNQQAARQLFSRYATLLGNNDAKVIDLYANNATIYLSRGESEDYTVSKSEYKEILGFLLTTTKKKGDRLQAYDVSYQPSGNRMQISATWYSPKSNIGFAHTLIVGADSKGRWMIFEEYQ